MNQASSYNILVFLLVLVLSTFITTTISSLIGIAYFLMVLYMLNQKMGNEIPLVEVMVLLSLIQWVIGPILYYFGFSDHYKYYMYIPESEYMPFAITGVAMFHLGAALFTKSILSRNNTEFIHLGEQLKENRIKIFTLFFIGILATINSKYMPPSLSFVFYLLASLKYIALIYYFFAEVKNRRIYLVVAIILSFISSLQGAMFHDFILWMVFLGLYFSVVEKIVAERKFLILVLAFVIVALIQLGKQEYRNYVWYGGVADSRLETYMNVIKTRFETVRDDEESKEEYVESFVNRINQGWIISRIMYYIPEYEDFLHGESIRNAVGASILPRFLNPNKQVVGGKDYFPRLTGYTLTGTSMGASLLGEGYANYGKTGAYIFLFVYGIFIGLIIRIIVHIGQRNPTVLLWIPLIFFQVIKAESDLVRVLNHLTKASLLTALIYWGFNRILGWRI